MAIETEEERDAARRRISGEISEGMTVTYKDGTVTEDGVVTKAGRLVIVGEDGEIAGWKTTEEHH